MIENDVNMWAEAIASLPDKQFFTIMNLYLGETKSPYNKQRLTQQLASFIRKPQNTSSILTLLDCFDIKVLTAISLMSNVTPEILTDFFKNNYKVSEILSEIINLKERLLIYTKKDSYSTNEIIYINPLLSEQLNNYLDINLLFPHEVIITYSTEDIFTISPNFIAAFISYLKVYKISCKADGLIKKTNITRLEQVFPGKIELIQLLVNAFINLSLIIDDGKYLKLDEKKLEAFVQLSQDQQYAFICAASVSRFSREGLKKEAQLLLDCLSAIPDTGYSTKTLLWLAYLIGTHTKDGQAIAKQGRFSQILQAARSAEDTKNAADILDRMIDSAITLGLLQKIGNNNDGTPIYIKGNFLQSVAPESSQMPKVLNIDSTFTVTLMPGLPLKELLPLTSFMAIKKCGIVTELEVTKQAVSIGFDQGFTPESIFSTLENFTYYEIPQNLKINVQDWYNAYSSAILYKGYILKVTENNIKIAENNPNIKCYIKEKLADGIYLLNIPLDANISDFKEESGLEFLGSIKTYSKQETSIGFPILQKTKTPDFIAEAKSREYIKISLSKTENLLKQLQDSLAAKDINEHKKECLEYRIKNRLILTPQQLDIAAIRTEILEADGMDFSGKLHLIEVSIKEEDILELQLPDAKGNFVTLVGHPLALSKQQSEAILKFQFIEDETIDNFLVSRITHIKRLRY